MKTQDAIKIELGTAEIIANAYLDDLSDADLMHRPHPQCNHLNWQVGHLVASEFEMMNPFVPGGMPPLPEGFAARYSKETAGSDDPSQFATKAELMAAFRTQRDATLAALARTGEAEFDKETGISYAPTLAALYLVQGSHWLMHCGQWVIVRRQLGKPVVI
jgi:hypothetical protein